ncbi:MAG: xanthine dehydrogenase family protein molybdopterin-binding subunit [Ardenticatenaceae bacterium]
MVSTTKSPPVKEQLPLLQGLGRYVDDINLPGTLHVAFVRSPYAHARLVSVETEEAARQPGVLAVFSGEELRAKIKPLRAPLNDPTYQATDFYPLTWDKVHYVGEAVAVVVAVNRYLAEDAAECVMVEYDPLPVVATVTQSMAADAPRIHDELVSNILIEKRIETGEAEDAFEQAEIRVRSTFQHPRVSCLPMENCGVLADYRAESDELVVWSSTQVPHLLRDALSDCLDQPADQLRVIAPNVGGGFGLKSQVFPEELLIPYLARRLGRPVKWIQDRMEHLQASVHSRDDIVEAELAARSDGTIIGVRSKGICDVGAYNSYPFSSALEPFSLGGCLTGPYDFPFYSFHGYGVATNKCPGGPYRGVGAVLGPMVMEGLLDELADKLDMDPTEVRMKNLARPEQFPFESPAGSVYDSGDYPALLDLAIEEAGYPGWRTQQRSARNDEARLVGIGISCFVEATTFGPETYAKRGMTAIPGYDAATLRLNQQGELEAFVSTPSQGQGQYTTFAQLLSQKMGIPFDQIHVHLGDTATSPYGSGTWSSRSLVGGGNALLKAAKKLQEKLVKLAAVYWKVEPAQVTYAKGAARLTGNRSQRLTIAELAKIAYGSVVEFPPDMEPGLEINQVYNPPPSTTSAAVHMAMVEIDRETGEVAVHDYIVAEDCGPIINKQVVDGQVRGGIAQGIGIALWEELLYDEQGQLLTGTLMDYLVPGAYESAKIQIVHMTTPSPWNDGGFKGVAESGIIGAPAAITNAVLDALQVHPTHIQLPLTPERILGWLEEGGGE